MCFFSISLKLINQWNFQNFIAYELINLPIIKFVRSLHLLDLHFKFKIQHLNVIRIGKSDNIPVWLWNRACFHFEPMRINYIWSEYGQQPVQFILLFCQPLFFCITRRFRFLSLAAVWACSEWKRWTVHSFRVCKNRVFAVAAAQHTAKPKHRSLHRHAIISIANFSFAISAHTRTHY